VKILRVTVKRDFTDLSRCHSTHLVVTVPNNVKFLFLSNITFISKNENIFTFPSLRTATNSRDRVSSYDTNHNIDTPVLQDPRKCANIMKTRSETN